MHILVWLYIFLWLYIMKNTCICMEFGHIKGIKHKFVCQLKALKPTKLLDIFIDSKAFYTRGNEICNYIKTILPLSCIKIVRKNYFYLNDNREFNEFTYGPLFE